MTIFVGGEITPVSEIEMIPMSLTSRENFETKQILFAGSKDLLYINSEIGVAAAIEARRLAEKYDKDFLDCDDLVKIIGVGKNNIRQLLNSDAFPTIEIGNRKVVSVIAFALWSMRNKSDF